jgi:hypothetical protein
VQEEVEVNDSKEQTSEGEEEEMGEDEQSEN